eukprot:701663-Pyramimonas_sp.AAC.2
MLKLNATILAYRATKFGTEYKEPSKTRIFVCHHCQHQRPGVVFSRTELKRMEHKRPGFATGIDLLSE